MTDIKLTAYFQFADGSRQVINMSQEAYDNMKHDVKGSLMRIAHDFNAVSVDFYVADK